MGLYGLVWVWAYRVRFKDVGLTGFGLRLRVSGLGCRSTVWGLEFWGFTVSRDQGLKFFAARGEMETWQEFWVEGLGGVLALSSMCALARNIYKGPFFSGSCVLTRGQRVPSSEIIGHCR